MTHSCCAKDLKLFPIIFVLSYTALSFRIELQSLKIATRWYDIHWQDILKFNLFRAHFPIDERNHDNVHWECELNENRCTIGPIWIPIYFIFFTLCIYIAKHYFQGSTSMKLQFSYNYIWECRYRLIKCIMLA